MMDRRLVLLAPEDNCLVVTQRIAPGEQMELDGTPITITAAVGIGHKLARTAIARGEKILKYGAIIGHASAAIAAGAHIHTHNLQSDYTVTFTRDAGSRFVQDPG
ncbi:MAG: SAF domain-containing protein [Betaproteobacteria bacterium]